MIPVTIQTLIMTAPPSPSIIVLQPEEEATQQRTRRVVPIWIGTAEATQMGIALEKARFSLSDALWEAADPFAPLIRAAGKGYSQSIEDGLSLNGDRAAVQQTASILLDNALKYTPEGGGISLRAFRSGRRNIIEVSNTCEGLDETDLERLFDRFYRADKSRSGAVKGSGIGLSIAKAAVEAHGGRIRAEKSAHGIMFQVTL